MTNLNFACEYWALQSETALTELPPLQSTLKRTGLGDAEVPG